MGRNQRPARLAKRRTKNASKMTSLPQFAKKFVQVMMTDLEILMTPTMTTNLLSSVLRNQRPAKLAKRRMNNASKMTSLPQFAKKFVLVMITDLVTLMTPTMKTNLLSSVLRNQSLAKLARRQTKHASKMTSFQEFAKKFAQLTRLKKIR